MSTKLLDWHLQQAGELAKTILDGVPATFDDYKYLVGRLHAHREALDYARSDESEK